MQSVEIKVMVEFETKEGVFVAIDPLEVTDIYFDHGQVGIGLKRSPEMYRGGEITQEQYQKLVKQIIIAKTLNKSD